jgi:sulfur-carrier protein adenylyltransferase/sulfurtransferase
MIMIAEDPTAAALLAVVPCYPVPSSGGSPALDALRGSRAGHGLAVGKDGVMLILRRPWLALDAPVTPPIAAYLPYGSIGSPKADLRCGLIPGEHLAAILDHFRAALPNEAAAFILWNETTNTFAVDFPAIDDATPTRLVYRPPVCEPGWHMVCDRLCGRRPRYENFARHRPAPRSRWPGHGSAALRGRHVPGRTAQSIFRRQSMQPESPKRHYLPAAFDNSAVRILLVGCGGNGAQMLMGLASLDTALRAISSRSLEVTVVDEDIVTEANLGRQPFYRCDLGNSKARTLTERINLAHGLAWKAVHGRAPGAIGVDNSHVLISCVDTASARRALGAALQDARNPPIYWLDLGNRASDGQYLIGCPGRGTGRDDNRLPTVLEAFPELADEGLAEDDAPSCSVAEALERQSLFVNRVLASHALALLFDLLGRGSIGHAGAFVNLATGYSVPIPLPMKVVSLC